MLKKYALTAATAVGLVLAVGLPAFESQASAPAKTSQPDPAKIATGQTVFESKCLQCHSANEGQNSFGPSLYHLMARPHPKKTSGQVRAIIKDGKSKMPAFGDRITVQDTDDLIAYLRTL
jgi:mono/diheme cytochrome c family protein